MAGRKDFLRRWAARPTFYYEIGGIGSAVGILYIANLDTVPVSGRRRFNMVSEDNELWAGKQQYEETMQQFGHQLLPAHHPQSRMVQRVLDRLIPHSGIAGDDWEVHVIQDGMQNAFVIPGGKVFVFSGILDTCENDDGLAAVLGHEIAHNVAHHAAERMSQSSILMAVAWAVQFALQIDIGISRMVMEYAFARPGSRSQESEADYIGLMMMAEACYDPREAVNFWARMEKQEQASIPQFLSTHPSNHDRIEKITEWQHDAQLKRDASECASTTGFAEDFKKKVPSLVRW